MIDKNGNIICEKGKIDKFFQFIKENTAQVAIAIPVLVSIYGIVSNYYFYIINRGYYKYFGIDSQLMLPYNKNNLYHNIGAFVLVLLYLGYAILTVRILTMRKNYVKKFFCSIIIPLLINMWIFYEGNINLSLLKACVKYIPFQWIMIASFGIGMALSIYPEILQDLKSQQKRVDRKRVNRKRVNRKRVNRKRVNRKRVNRKKSTEKNQKKCEKRRGRRTWNNKDDMILGGVLILAGCIIFFVHGYCDNKNLAESKTRFGIVQVKNEEYAVIDENEDKLILQQCEIENKKIRININTYLCRDNNMIINFRKFETVEPVEN